MPALTLLDWAKRQGPDSKQAKIVELLNQTNEILDDMLLSKLTRQPDIALQYVPACRLQRGAC